MSDIWNELEKKYRASASYPPLFLGKGAKENAKTHILIDRKGKLKPLCGVANTKNMKISEAFSDFSEVTCNRCDVTLMSWFFKSDSTKVVVNFILNTTEFSESEKKVVEKNRALTDLYIQKDKILSKISYLKDELTHIRCCGKYDNDPIDTRKITAFGIAETLVKKEDWNPEPELLRILLNYIKTHRQ